MRNDTEHDNNKQVFRDETHAPITFLGAVLWMLNSCRDTKNVLTIREEWCILQIKPRRALYLKMDC